MTNTDLQNAAKLFKQLADDASSLDKQLATLGAQGLSAAHAQALQALVALATNGQARLASGAAARRSDEIAKTKTEIQALQNALILGGDVTTINEKIADKDAKLAVLLADEIGDFGDVVAPAQVSALIELTKKVSAAASQKQQAASIIAFVGQIVSEGVEIAAAIAKVAG